ncbi:heavy metal sensor histidine kinase [Paraburkholderia sp. A1RI_3L]|uniref:heavy metal sensor histidine kinase n=1 Tax=Paraburkholderia TaxID=1822464 RepID=UPI003B77ED0B
MTATESSWSMLRRLSCMFSLVAILVLSLAGGLLYHSLSFELRRRDDAEIAVQLAQFTQRAQELGTPRAISQNGDLFREALVAHPLVFFAIFDAQGHTLTDSARSGRRITAAAQEGGEPWAPYTCNPATLGPSRCIFADQLLPSGEPVRVVLAHQAVVRDAVMRDYQQDALLTMLAGSLLMGLLGYAITRRGLAPVKSIGQRISRIEAHSLGERLDMAAGPVELHDIAIPVNRMLDRLQRAFARLSQFSSDLAHDMRTPLANMIGSSQITLSRERSVAEYQALIDSNIEECERLQRMIETMLFIARADHAKEPLKIGVLDCQGEFSRLASYFDAVAEDKRVRLVMDGTLPIPADPTMFRRAMSNLLSNALDHADAESEIAIRAYRANAYVAVEVTNHGATIPPGHLDKVFDRFYRVNPAREQSAKNMGLGLAIVKSIMESHRGRVDVMSTAGRTTFTLYFPLVV